MGQSKPRTRARGKGSGKKGTEIRRVAGRLGTVALPVYSALLPLVKGRLEDAVFLTALLAAAPDTDESLWFEVTRPVLRDATFLSADRQRTSEKHLRMAGLIETAKLPAAVRYRIVDEGLDGVIQPRESRREPRESRRSEESTTSDASLGSPNAESVTTREDDGRFKGKVVAFKSRYKERARAGAVATTVGSKDKGKNGSRDKVEGDAGASRGPKVRGGKGKTEPRRPLVPFPTDLALDVRVTLYAKQHGCLDPDAMFEGFRSWAEEGDHRSRSWSLRLLRWIRDGHDAKAPEFKHCACGWKDKAPPSGSSGSRVGRNTFKERERRKKRQQEKAAPQAVAS